MVSVSPRWHACLLRIPGSVRLWSAQGSGALADRPRAAATATERACAWTLLGGSWHPVLPLEADLSLEDQPLYLSPAPPAWPPNLSHLWHTVRRRSGSLGAGSPRNDPFSVAASLPSSWAAANPSAPHAPAAVTAQSQELAAAIAQAWRGLPPEVREQAWP